MMEPTRTLSLSLQVNGVSRRTTAATHLTLADYLRDDLGLHGCKIACDAAVCGACTVLVGGEPMAACSTFMFELEDADVTTVEGLAGPDGLHPVQTAFLEADAFQCGFCTPGMMLAVKALLDVDPDPDEATIQSWLQGNICRCTGYRMIIEAVRRAAELGRAVRVEGGA
jgi:aerobic-type carbon monoxide dehydrogenase small subunit (CoxS/CutS family)